MNAEISAKTLARDTRCALCGEKMRAGETFRWYLKSGVRSGSRAGGTNDRYCPAHTDVLVCDRIMHADAEANKLVLLNKTNELADAISSGEISTPDEMMAWLQPVST